MLLDLRSLVEAPAPPIIHISGAPGILLRRPRRLLPILAAISPATVRAGGRAFLLTVHGSQFVSTSVVQLDDSPRMTTFVSAGELVAAILPRDIFFPGIRRVSVVTPSEGRSRELGLSVLDREGVSLVDVRWLVLLDEL